MSDTATMIKALRALSCDIQSGDGVANACVADAADMIERMESQLAKTDEVISECWRLVGNDVDNESTLYEHVNALNERVKELERELLNSATVIEGNSNLNVLAGMMREVANAEQLRKEQTQC